MIPMFTVTAQVVHVFRTPEKTNKETGEVWGGQDKVQLLGDMPLQNGEYKKEMITLTTDQGAILEKAVGRTVTVPVLAYAKASQVYHYIPKGAQIDLGEQ